MSTMLRGQHDGLVWGSKNSTVGGPGKGARGKQRAGKGNAAESSSRMARPALSPKEASPARPHPKKRKSSFAPGRGQGVKGEMRR